MHVEGQERDVQLLRHATVDIIESSVYSPTKVSVLYTRFCIWFWQLPKH